MKQNEIIKVGNFEIKIERKKIKNIYLKVKRDGDILLSAPMNVEQTFLYEFVQSKIDWLEQKTTVIQKRQPQHEPINEQTNSIYYFGVRYDILKIKATKPMITLSEPYLKMYVTSAMNEQKQQALLETWLQKQLEQFIYDCLMKYWSYFKSRGVAPIEVKYRKMNSTWGVCRPVRRTITFNKRLIHCHPQFIEYVVVHELCHLIHPNHSPQFYELVEQLLPVWKTYSKRSR